MSAPDPSLIAKALDWQRMGRRLALATVVQTWGSAPQPVGSLLLIDSDGNFIGSVSGGCVEAEVIAEAADVIASGAPKTLEFGVEDKTAWSVGLACGGAIRIHVGSLAGGDADAMLQSLAGDIEARQPVALLTDLATGARRLARSPADVTPGLVPFLQEAFRRDKCLVGAGEHGDVFIDVFHPRIRLIIAGATHIAQPLVAMARALDYDVIIVDPRQAFATKERFGGVKLLREWPDEALPGIGVDARTALIALTHDPKIDDPCLIHALRSDAFYVGALGSKATHASRVTRLIEAGVERDAIGRIHAPIGLDIGAQGAAEIALSIVAEIAAVTRGKSR
jgi:xanthine dehydrogenase accessory factor